jgi:amidase
VPLDTPTGKTLQNLKIAWTDEWLNFPVSSQIKSAIGAVASKLANVGTQIEQWVPEFDFVAAWQIYYAVATYLNVGRRLPL